MFPQPCPIKVRAWDRRKLEMQHYPANRFLTINDFLLDNDYYYMLGTGLKDDLGIEIFDQDIVEHYWKIKKKETGEILERRQLYFVYHGHQAGYDYESSTFDGWLSSFIDGNWSEPLLDASNIKYDNPYWDCIEERYRIIGNRYENKDLLPAEEA